MRGEIPEGETLSREYLANERTLLSWIRTGINAIGFGVLLHAVARILPGLPADELAFGGVAMVVFGTFIELVAVARFLQYRYSISRGEFTPSSLLYPLVTLGLAMLVAGYIIYVLVA